jgi:hypothetical protein
MHVAAAGTPIVAVFGQQLPGVPGHRPANPSSSSAPECSPCSYVDMALAYAKVVPHGRMRMVTAERADCRANNFDGHDVEGHNMLCPYSYPHFQSGSASSACQLTVLLTLNG